MIMPETLTLNIAGSEIKLTVEPDEKEIVKKTAEEVSDRISQLTEKLTTSSAAKVATMVAFEFACQLSEANVMLDEAEKLHTEIETHKQAIHKLEGLLDKVDDALLA